MFDVYIGIDYSGAKSASSPLSELQVYSCRPGELPYGMQAPSMPQPHDRQQWSRSAIALWLIEKIREPVRFIAGIDHAFSFPTTYLDRYHLDNWDAFLDDFQPHWPTDQDGALVNELRPGNPRTGGNDELRVTETWTTSANSVFHFDIPGQVAPATHAGIPWLRFIRRQTGAAVHFWPFDGWDVPNSKSLIVEVYPSIFRRRYTDTARTGHARDAYVVTRWLHDSDSNGILRSYFHPPLTYAERRTAEREGWILGVA